MPAYCAYMSLVRIFAVDIVRVSRAVKEVRAMNPEQYLLKHMHSI